MDPNKRAQYYVYHQKNIKLIEVGMNAIQRDIKATYIREYQIGLQASNGQAQAVEIVKREREVYVRLLSGVIVSWSEQLLRRLVLEPNAFTPEQIDRFYRLQDARQKWTQLLKVAFCNKFIPYQQTDPMYARIDNPENETTIRRSLRQKYEDVSRLIENEIVPSIDLRNKVQHGEWKIAFNSPYSIDFDADLTKKVNQQNIRTLQTLIHDIQAIYKMIKDIATFSSGNFALASPTPFEHFFDQNFERIESNKKNLITNSEKVYRQKLVSKYIKGLAYRSSQENN